MTVKHRLKRDELAILIRIAIEGRLITKAIGGPGLLTLGLPSWMNNEFDLARALVSSARHAYVEEDKRKQRQDGVKSKASTDKKTPKARSRPRVIRL